jgi:HD-like signal output (HDOD) protein
MRFFRTEPPPRVRRPADPVPENTKPHIIEGWTENELVSVYQAASVKHLRRGESIFTDVNSSDSFFVLVDGAIQVTVKLNGQPGRPGIFLRGDCVSPLPLSPGLSYSAETAAESTIIEISPGILRNLSDKAQLCIYRVATNSTTKANTNIRTVNGELSLRNLRLSQYILNQNAARTAAIQSEFVKDFIQKMRRMPMYATDLAAKLLDDNVSVQEVVEGIKRDPSLVAIVLRTVNSAQYAFANKIESFYHACMILGFNNIYDLLMREATQSTMPITRETTRIHKHSCLTSVLCYEIASMANEPQPQSAATIGLLHDLGKGVQVVMKHAQPAKADFVNTLDSSKLGGAVLRVWGIPERVCRSVEFQQHPEFLPPDLMAPEYRRDTAALHIAHVLETLLIEKPLEPSRTIYTAEYMGVLGFGALTPAELLKDRILPTLLKNRARIPLEIRNIIIKPAPVNS